MPSAVLLPIAWLRVLLELAGMPLLLDTGLSRRVADLVRGWFPVSHPSRRHRRQHTTGSPRAGDPPAEARPAPAPAVDIPDESDSSGARADPPLHRAERREQQGQDAQDNRNRWRAI